METRVRAVVEKLSAVNPHRGRSDLPEPPRFQFQPPNRRLPVATQLAAAQRSIALLQYNFLPSTFYALQKMRPLRSLLSTAQEMAAESLPIRCLEATFLAVYLTQHMTDVDRFPLAFKSQCKGECYRHIVLVVRHKGLYGALGLSRVVTLMDKPLTYASLLDLLDDYCASYAAHGHDLVTIKLGLNFAHDPLSRQVPFWRFISTPVPHRRRGSGGARAGQQAPAQQVNTTDAEGTSAASTSPAEVPIVTHGRRRGGDSPASAAMTHAAAPRAPLASYKQDAAFSLLVDRFCEMLTALSSEYTVGTGEAATNAQAAARRVGRTMERGPPRGPGSASAQPVLQRPPRGNTSAPDRDVVDIAPAPVGPQEAAGGAEGDDDSDTEDNAHRVHCIRMGVSPFSRLAATAQHRSTSEQPPPRQSLVNRIRGLGRARADHDLDESAAE
jgi:hypothetical protein